MLWITIDRSQPMPLFRQIYAEIRNKILKGELLGGDPLPSTRRLAAELHLSRNVVLEAYEQLLAEGFLESRPGSGHYVAAGIDPAPLSRGENDLDKHALLKDTEATRLHPADPATVESAPALIDFRSGVPCLDHFPRALWGKLLQQVCREAPLAAFGYGRPEGRAELRQVLSRYLYRTRGVQCAPEQIVITSGATQAFVLIAKVLLKPDSAVVLEDPITRDIQTIFASTGAKLIPVPVDEYGLKTDGLPADARPEFVLVTPSHQFPLGGTLPIQRRIQLIRYASQQDCYIVEDDYDSEFRYDSPPVHSLQGLSGERVIYIGSFSKILSPSLRLGYLVLPPDLVEKYQAAKWFTDLHTPAIEQLALGRFIEGGHLDKYINRVKKVYKRRRQVLLGALQTAFPHRVKIWGASTGLHIAASFPGIAFTEEKLSSLAAAGVNVYPVEEHTMVKGRHQDKVIIGYGNVDEADIAAGIGRLHEVLG
ncbi:PLP-dependent aminotransferase family protein [Brevibacillus ruminantium]|uniref:PLP-dependent aminotransferase family protein n=1 Tax=Brevibacillus ruminantium TaxID=2950604 RepID=A0ABY4WHY6_9BACL|nr:PLP-dependent aminotransferase family protein [Brevibacillus ruminantium]USG64954.1 PLP-dependent aminotransferase family protein [Brevibacillus ruminantium]